MAKTKKPRTADICRELAKPVLERMGLTLWDLRYEKEGQNFYLRYFIDKPGGVDIADCENFSRALDALLDELDPIEQSYILEVGSPGIERTLSAPEHFAACIGMRVHLRLIRPLEGKKDILGALVSGTAEGITVQTADEGERFIPKGDAAWVKLAQVTDTTGGRELI
jgi:ribosome maturation factor RimP